MRDTGLDPDRELVREAAAGSREAFDQLVVRYQSRIFNLARVLTANDDAAEDLAQEAFIRAYRAIRRFRGDSSFKTWLYAVATNVIRTHLTRRGKRTWHWSQPGGDEMDVEQMPSEHIDVERDLVLRDAVDRALATLPAEFRIAVTLRDVHGLEYREIAEMLNVPIGTVESRIFRARQRLRPLLAPLISRGADTASAGATEDASGSLAAGPISDTALQEAKRC